MPKKNKSQNSAFYWYMQELRPEMSRQGRGVSMPELVAYSRPRWKALTDEEQEKYERMAKEHKKREQKSSKADEHRLDNQGNVIAHREDGDLDMTKRRNRDRKIARSRWPPAEEILDYPFYFISFQYLCEIEDNSWLPCEVAIVEWSMEEGISKTFHRFIDPGGIPLGFRFSCQSHSDDTHQIPIDNFEQASRNYRGIYIEIENFINPNGSKSEYPPLYAICGGDSKEWKMVSCCMNWLYEQACMGHVNRLQKIYSLEDMVVDIYGLMEKPLSESSAIILLTTTTWDYERNTRCPYHEEVETKHCALGTCKRYAFALSDALKTVYNFELTENHLPIQDDTPAYTIITPSAVNMDTRPVRNRIQPTSYSALRSSNQGNFGARDVRYQNGDDDYDDDDDDSMSVRSTQTTYGGSTVSSWSTQPKAAPWARAASTTTQSAPSVTSEDDFPLLDGASMTSTDDFPALNAGAKPKYAGRAMAPHPSELPRPGWQGPPESLQRLPNSVPMSSAPQPMTQKPTIHQAVQNTYPSGPPQNMPQFNRPARPNLPSAGRGFRPTGPSRAVNSGSFNPMQGAPSSTPQGQTAHGGSPGRPMIGQQGVAPQTAPGRPMIGQQGGTPQTGSPARPDATAHGGPEGRPTLGQAVQASNLPPKKQTPAEAARQPAWQQPANTVSAPPTQRPAAQPPGGHNRQPQGVAPVNGPPQVLQGLGRGRGRGIYSNVPRAAGGGTGMAAPPGVTRPPPGFGRGITAQLESVSLGKYD